MPQPQIFLSYARDDADAAKRLCSDLRAQNRRIWYDRDCLRGGEKWRDAIYSEIQKSDFFLALLSRASVSKRGMVQAELKKALAVLDEIPDDRIYLIPVRLMECSPASPQLKELHWIDLFPRWEEGIKHIIKSTDPDTGTPDLSDSPTPLDDLLKTMPKMISWKVPTTRIRISDAVRAAIDLFRNYAQSRNIEIRFEDKGPDATVRAFSPLLITVFANIISNAIKYSYTTARQPSWVDISSEKTENGIRIRVENWGVGIPESERDAIFARGYRGAFGHQFSSEGQGMGLAIAKRICDDYRGSIELHSRPVRSHLGEGMYEPFVTTVVITLPTESEQ